jgi:hypothetical protein
MLDHVSVLLMKIRIIKADFALLLNQASLLFGEPFPVIAAALPCSAFSLPCYGITAKSAYKLLIGKDNKSNKLPQNREEKISFPVLSLFRPINRENCRISSRAECLQRHPDIVSNSPKSWFTQRRKEHVLADMPYAATGGIER